MILAALLVGLPYRNNCAEWAQLTPEEQRTLDTVRDCVALGGFGSVALSDYEMLRTAYDRLHGQAVSPPPHGGGDDGVMP